MTFEEWFSAYEERLYNLKGIFLDSRLPTRRERFQECWQFARQAALEEAAERYERIRLYESKCSVITETLESKWPCGICDYCLKAQKLREMEK